MFIILISSGNIKKVGFSLLSRNNLQSYIFIISILRHLNHCYCLLKLFQCPSRVAASSLHYFLRSWENVHILRGTKSPHHITQHVLVSSSENLRNKDLEDLRTETEPEGAFVFFFFTLKILDIFPNNVLKTF